MEPHAHRTGGHLWGPRRAAARISLRQLAEASGINRGDLSRFETGRMIPTGAEFDRVMAALDRLMGGAAA